MTRRKPVFAQLQTQASLTLALLPLVAGLPFLDDAMLARLFGQSMAILNWVPQAPDIQFSTLPSLKELNQRPRTLEEQRRYQRHYKRIYRARHRLAELEARERGLAKLTPEERAALKLPE